MKVFQSFFTQRSFPPARNRFAPFLLLICAMLVLFSLPAGGQGTIQEYGKNRVQYNDDFRNWNQYETQNFMIYYYGKSREIADAAAQLAEANNTLIRNALEYRFNEKIQVIVYADLVDFKQSNIGNEEVFGAEVGETKVAETKLFVYYTGDIRDFRRQIREGITKVYLEQMQVGSSIQEFVQNAVSSDLPLWYTLGMISTIGRDWDAEVENRLRQLIASDHFETFDELARDHPKEAGHMFWKYVQQTYGRDVIANLLYLNRINRNIETTFQYSLGITIDQLLENAFRFFEEKFREEAQRWKPLPGNARIPLPNKKGLPYTQVALHPDGETVAYITNEIGQYKLYLTDPKGEKERLLKREFKNPFQSPDLQNPIIRWSPDGHMLGMIYEKRDLRYFQYWDFQKDETGRVKLDPRYERVYEFDFYDDNQLILSATELGYVDLYLFNLRRRSSERLTTDYFDDRDVHTATIDGRKGILFASNRNNEVLDIQRRDTSLPLRNFDLFFLDLTEDARRITRLTKSPDTDERMPFYEPEEDKVYYNALHSGMQRLFRAELLFKVDTIGKVVHLSTGRNIRLQKGRQLRRIDSRLIEKETPWVDSIYSLAPKNLTNFNTHIDQMSISGGHIAFSIPHHRTYCLFHQPLSAFEGQAVRPTIFHKKPSASTSTPLPDPAEETPPEEPEEQRTIKFQSPFEDPPEIEKLRPQTEAPAELSNSLSIPDILDRLRLQEPEYQRFNANKATAHRLHFRFKSFTTKMDNEPLFGGLNTFAGQPQGFSFPPLGLLGKFTASDLFEDYEITAGARFPTTFNGSEYFVVFDDNKKRWDKRYAIYRRVQRNTREGPVNIRLETKNVDLIGIYRLKYPLDIFRSFRITSTLRFDTYETLSTARPTLETPAINTQRLGVKGEYVFDNTYPLHLNMLQGSRYKFWVEGLNRFQIQLAPWEFSLSDAFMTIVGLDARHYMPLGRHAILAGRVAGAASFGSEQMLFFMGGVDNWLFAQYSDNIGIPQDGNFAFETLAGNMRGFKQNARNGSSYLVSNLELRVAPFNYLSTRKLQSDFLRNFQIVGFLDLGTAWFGLSPFSDDNPLNTTTLTNPTVELRVNYFRDPIIVGYGAGVRADLFGYFVRLDYAWGIETKVVQDPILYLSLGLDF